MLKCSDSARSLHVFGLKRLCMITHLSRGRLVSDRLHPVWNKPIASPLLGQFFSGWLISRGFESGKIMTLRPFTMTGSSCVGFTEDKTAGICFYFVLLPSVTFCDTWKMKAISRSTSLVASSHVSGKKGSNTEKLYICICSELKHAKTNTSMVL